MIALLSGKLLGVEQERHKVIIEVGGVGYQLMVHIRDMASLSSLPNTEAQLHCYLHVREDALELFGFLNLQEKYCFVDLISVNGIGPKLAMTILGASSLPELTQAVYTQNAAFFKGMAGVGPKIAQRIVLELQNKIKKWPAYVSQATGAPVGQLMQSLGLQSPEFEDLRSTFLNLGYASLQIERVLMEVARDGSFAKSAFEEKVRTVLKKLSSKPSQTLGTL